MVVVVLMLLVILLVLVMTMVLLLTPCDGEWLLLSPVYLTAKPTVISNSFGQYFNKLIPPFGDPVYTNMKDNFRMYVPPSHFTVTLPAPDTQYAASIMIEGTWDWTRPLPASTLTWTPPTSTPLGFRTISLPTGRTVGSSSL